MSLWDSSSPLPSAKGRPCQVLVVIPWGLPFPSKVILYLRDTYRQFPPWRLTECAVEKPSGAEGRGRPTIIPP